MISFTVSPFSSFSSAFMILPCASLVNFTPFPSEWVIPLRDMFTVLPFLSSAFKSPWSASR